MKLFKSNKPNADSEQLMPLSEARMRYTKWLSFLKQKGLFSVEHLLPTIETPCPADLQALMVYGATLRIEDEEALKAEIECLKPRGYDIQLSPGVTTFAH